MIKVYTLSNCPNCEELKNIFKQKNILFEEINIDEDFKARAKMIENDIEEMPAVEISGKLQTWPIKDINNLIIE